jgi:ankyrin repeat protein
MTKILLSSALLLALVPAIVAGAGDETAVADAVMHRDVTSLRALLARKADVNSPQPDGSTALHWAAYWNDVTAADLLLKAGAAPAPATRLGATPLFLAVQSGTPAMVSRLLEAGADVNAPFLETVKLLLDAKANVNAQETLRETTAVSWAAEENHAEVVALLLSRGADPAAASKVTVAAGRGGGGGGGAAAAPNPNAPPPIPGLNPNARGGVSPLMVATRERATATIKVLLDAGAPINQRAGDGTTALVVSLQNGDAATAKLLIERGADVNLPNARGWAPLFLAVKARTREMGTVPNPVIDAAGLMDVIKMMVERGADVNARTVANSEVYGATTWFEDAGATPIVRAAYCADLEVIKYLMAHGADPKIPMTDGTTSLMAITGVGYGDGFTKDFGTPDETFAALQILVEAGVPINAANSSKVTALHGAAHKNFVRGIQYLVDHGADMTMVSFYTAPDGFIRVGSKGQSVLDWATGVMVNGQSSSYKTEAVELVTKLMKERGMPVDNLTNTRGGLNATQTR